MNLHDFGFDNVFLDMTPKAQATNITKNKLNFIRRMRRQPTKWEKIFEDHICDKSLFNVQNI